MNIVGKINQNTFIGKLTILLKHEYRQNVQIGERGSAKWEVLQHCFPGWADAISVVNDGATASGIDDRDASPPR